KNLLKKLKLDVLGSYLINHSPSDLSISSYDKSMPNRFGIFLSYKIITILHLFTLLFVVNFFKLVPIFK
ncbi:hypothetical protein, partial [Bacillus sp. JJ722]|uniref:hypothetical protein n=1 Tax=Bacillus sp. JJ722 TaxID=3122973 RepID=UPI002FFFFDB5